MNRVETGAQNLITAIKMMQIGARIVLTGIAVALRIQRSGIALVLRVADFHYAVGDKKVSIAGVARRHHAVKHINAAAHALHPVFRFAHAHQVARFICRDLRADVLQNAVHILFRLADSQTADSVAIKAYLYQTFDRDIT